MRSPRPRCRVYKGLGLEDEQFRQMGKLSFAIVQQKLSSLRDVEEALARQILYGGDLATNLLDQAPGVDEAALTALSAESHGLKAAPARELPRSEPETLRRVPADVALRHGLYPLEQSERGLVLAVSEPLSPDVERDLAGALETTLQQRIAPMVRIRQAIARDYGLPLDRRTSRIIAKLEGRPDPSPSLEPPPLSIAPDFSSLPRPPSMPPFGLAPADTAPLYAALKPPSDRPAPPSRRDTSPPKVIRPMSVVPITRRVEPVQKSDAKKDVLPSTPAATRDLPVLPLTPAPPRDATGLPGGPTPVRDVALLPSKPGPIPVEEDTTSVHDRVTAKAPPVAAPTSDVTNGTTRVVSPGPAIDAWSARGKQTPPTLSRHRGPYTAPAAEEDMLAAEERDPILAAFFDFARQYFEYSALFVVHGDLAEGRVAYGPGADRAAVAGIGVPLDLPSSMATVRDEKRFVVTRLSSEGIDARLTQDLNRSADKQILLMPVLVRGRCVLIFYGDDGSVDVELSEIGDVIAFAPLVATALENLILKKKMAVRAAVKGPEPLTTLQSLRPKTQHTPQPSRELRAETLAQALGSVASSVPEQPSTPSSEQALTPEPDRGQKPKVVTPRPASAGEGSSPKPAVSKTVPAKPPKPESAAGNSAIATKPALPPKKRPSVDIPVATAKGTDATPVFSLSRKVDAKPSTDSDDDGWDLPVTRRELPSAGLIGEGPEISIAGLAELSLEDLGPSSESNVVVATQLPPKRHSSAELKLPKVILNLDNDVDAVVTRYLDGDESQLEQVVSLGAPAASVLAGRLPGPIKKMGDLDAVVASHCGPVLRALSRIGRTAAPFVAVRTNDADPSVRLWATRLTGELPSVESAQAVARRVADFDPQVRRAALESGRLLQSHDESRRVLRDRLGAMAAEPELPTDLRVSAVEAFAHFRDGSSVPILVRLLEQDDAVAQSALQALDVITRAHLPNSAAAWQTWWAANGNKHRIEWLIDALLHDDGATRRAAGDELKTLTKEYFGYYDDLPKKDRERAQRRYREWWEATGKARFLE